MNYFFDTTALVKIYHLEAGSDSVVEIYQGSDEILISDFSSLELQSIVTRKVKEKEIDSETGEAVIGRFEEDLKIRFRRLKFTSLVLDESLTLMKKYGRRFSLKTLDSLQLAFFKTYFDVEDVFVSADKRLVKVIELEGLTTMVPV